jgi:mRNA interferase MazF
MVNRGEVWWLEHPELGRRPVCVVTRQEAIPVLRRVLVVPATTRVRGIPTEIALGPEDGMPSVCALSVDNIQPVPKTMLTERIARLSGPRLDALCRAVDAATGC